MGNMGMIFAAYLACDLVLGIVHRLHSQGNAIHHVVFLIFAYLLARICCIQLISATMAMMELSTPFLNYYSFWKHRLGKKNVTVRLAMATFAILFLIFRIIVVFIVLGHFTRHLVRGTVTFNNTPLWIVSFVYLGIWAALGLQMFWFTKILNMTKASFARTKDDS